MGNRMNLEKKKRVKSINVLLDYERNGMNEFGLESKICTTRKLLLGCVEKKFQSKGCGLETKRKYNR